MTDTTLLNELVNNSGVTKIWLANKIGCSRQRLYKILDGSEVTASEIQSISEALRFTSATRDKVFFAQKVASNTTKE